MNGTRSRPHPAGPSRRSRVRRPGTLARRRAETGSGTVLGLALVGLLVAVTGLAGAVVAVVATHRQAQSAADLAALAGAVGLQEGTDPCTRAAAVAHRNRAHLARCRVTSAEVVVEVVATARLPGGGWDLRARAAAGPAEGLSGVRAVGSGAGGG